MWNPTERMRRFLRRSCYVAVVVAFLVFGYWDLWPTMVCTTNPMEPDAEHIYYVISASRGGGSTRCYVSASDAHAHNFIFAALAAAVAMAVLIGILTRRYPPLAK